jgi:hypothetical protein
MTFDEWWVEKYGTPPTDTMNRFAFGAAQDAWNFSSQGCVELNEKLRIQVQALVCERNEAVRKAQRHEELRRQTEKMLEKLRHACVISDLAPKQGPTIGVVADVSTEIIRARKKHPGNAHLLAALTEEVGELAQAFLDNQGHQRIYDEAKQCACVAMRIMEEGDGDFDE